MGLVAIGLALWSEFVRPYQRQGLVVQDQNDWRNVETRGVPLRLQRVAGADNIHDGSRHASLCLDVRLQRVAGADNIQDITLVDLSDGDPSPELRQQP